MMRDVPPIVVPELLRLNQRDLHGMAFLDYVQSLKGIDSPLYSALILDLCRLLPVDRQEMISTRMAGWSKEISVMEEHPRPCKIRWKVLFDPEWRNESILPGIAPNPYAASYCRLAFTRWRDKAQTKLHYPRMTFKNLPRSTRREMEDFMEVDLSEHPVIGQINLERLKMQTGYEAQGSLELRQRWYVSNAKPRTYFAQGGQTYHVSKHLQELFSDLADEFPFTARNTCLRPGRIQLTTEDNYLRIYDLEAFTSRMTEQRAFLDELSLFCEGYPFSYMDSREGIITRDMGEIIWEYNQVCNHAPEVSYERIEADLAGRPSRHHMAGPLGVFGNLVTCKVGHGCLVFQTVDSEDKLNCAGDDGALDSNPEIDTMLGECIESLGRDQEEKRFKSDEPGCICLKRPLTQEFNQIHHHLRVIPPSLYNLLHHGFGFSDPRFRHFGSEDMTQEEHRRVIATEIYRFTRSVHRSKAILTNVEKEDAYKLIEWSKEEFGFPTEGCIAGVNRMIYTFPYTYPEWCPQVQDYFEYDPVVVTAYNHFVMGAEIWRKEKIERVEIEDFKYVGSVFCSNESKHLVFLEKLGFVEKKPVMLEIDPMMISVEGFVHEYLNDFVPVVYEFTVIRDVPCHLIVTV